MHYNPFSIVVVPFPFADSSQIKKRPALVLSTNKFQIQTKHVTLLMITSALHSSWFGDYIIKDLETTGLSAQSIIRQKLFTIDMRFVIKMIGSLSSRDKTHVLLNFKKNISFND